VGAEEDDGSEQLKEEDSLKVDKLWGILGPLVNERKKER
jgi:hypothetical protein